MWLPTGPKKDILICFWASRLDDNMSWYMFIMLSLVIGPFDFSEILFKTCFSLFGSKTTSPLSLVVFCARCVRLFKSLTISSSTLSISFLIFSSSLFFFIFLNSHWHYYGFLTILVFNAFAQTCRTYLIVYRNHDFFTIKGINSIDKVFNIKTNFKVLFIR